MSNYQLSFYGPMGFDTKGFGTQEEAVQYAMEKSSIQVYSRGGYNPMIKPVEIRKYNEKTDRYEVIGKFTKKSA